MIFTNYRVIDVPVTNGTTTPFTTTSLSLVFFVPTGNRMEDDSPVGVYVANTFTDTDGGSANLWLYYSQAGTSATNQLNSPGHANQNNFQIGNIVPAGKQIKTYVGNSSDIVGGTLYVLELPNQP